MTLTEILKKQNLTDDQIKVITDSMKENKIHTTSLENADERYSKMKTKKEDLEGQLKTATSTIDELKKNNKDNETLQTTIKEHEKTIETLKADSETKIKNLIVTNAIKSKLTNAEEDFVEFLESRFDRDKLIVKEDESIEGLDEQFKTISESNPKMFKSSNPLNTGGIGNYGRGNNIDTSNNSQDRFMDAIRNNQLRK